MIIIIIFVYGIYVIVISNRASAEEDRAHDEQVLHILWRKASLCICHVIIVLLMVYLETV